MTFFLGWKDSGWTCEDIRSRVAEELRSGGSYFSQNDLRLHFGLEQAKQVDMVEVRWLSGQVDHVSG